VNFDDVDLETLRKKRGEKWREYGPDVLHAWVADMDFRVADVITQHLLETVRSSDLGYPINPRPGDLPTVFAKRMLDRFGWQVDPQRVLVITDVVQGIYVALQTLSEPGDGVVVQTPVYVPFLEAVRKMDRRMVNSALVPGPRGYEIDFDDLEARLDARTKIFLLCNPQNPTGRVFTRAELERLAELAIARDLVVIADEIWNELVHPGHRHVPFASLGPEVEARTITLTSATKTFNIAGLRCSVAAFGSDALKRRFDTVPRHLRGGIGSLGLSTTEVAWTSAQAWADEALAYLDGNRRFLAELLGRRIPAIRYTPPEATYLAWLDCRALALDTDPFTHFLERGRVGLSDGRRFGAGGEGFVRLNFATSRAMLEQIVERMARSLER
jgi:cystathionine beta-lyase